MDFSPYSPSPDDDRTSRLPKKSKQTKQQQQQQPSFNSYQAGNADSFAEQGLLNDGNMGSSSSSTNAGPNGQSVRVNKYETSLPVRVDIEAALAYVLGPVTGNFILLNLLLT